MPRLLDDILRANVAGSGLMGALPVSYPTSAPDAADEKKKRDAALYDAIAQNPYDGFVNPNATPLYPQLFGGASAPMGVQPGPYGGSTPFGLGDINLPPSGAPASGPLPAAAYSPLAAPILPPAEGPRSGARAPAMNPSVGFPSPPPENQTARALRMRGVPEADVAAAMSDPERLQQLINQIYHSDAAAAQSALPSAAAPAADDTRWASRAPTAPMVLPPQAGQSDAPYWTQALDDAPGASGAVRPAAPPQPTTPGTAAQNLKAQYDTLLPILGPQKAMLALMNPEAGKTLLNAALTAHALRMKGVPEIDNDPLNGMHPTGSSAGDAAGFNSPNQIRSGPPGGARGALSGPPQNSSDRNAADPTPRCSLLNMRRRYQACRCRHLVGYTARGHRKTMHGPPILSTRTSAPPSRSGS
jgi:hypothetical protein